MPQYAQYSSTIGGSPEEDNNAMRVLSLGSVGTTNTRSNFSVVGFSNRLNPNEGKVTSIASFATNNQTVGTIRVPQLINGSTPTLQTIADQYGTTVEQLALVNNLPSPDVDITGLSITVPADILTVDYYTVEPNANGTSTQTPRSLAQRFDISVSWLMDINGWTNSEQALAPGQLVQVPGLAKSCASQPTAPGCRTTALPAAKPLAAELETADYGAYTTTEVTYDCAGQLMAFCSRFLRPFR
jgi:LysM repeat protein